MKFLLLISLAIFANAGWVTSVQSATDKTLLSQKFSVETYGVNQRAYVFQAPMSGSSTMTCIIVYTESDLGEKSPKSISPVMQCIKN